MNPPAELTVNVSGLEKRFGSVEVLNNIAFHVSPGEIVCVWGPSGAGKSTLLHVLGLMTPPSAGDVAIFGHPISDLSDNAAAKFRNEQIGFLFQFHHLLPDLSLLENVMIPLLIRRTPRSEANQRARRLLQELRLEHRLDHRPSQASGGEQQRTALARALIGEPSLVLADEPTGNLDRNTGRAVQQLLHERVRSANAALIFVTHDEHLASTADRRLILIDGALSPA